MAQAAGTLDYAKAQPQDSFDVWAWMRLSIMMFLQFAVWGSWFVVLGRYLGVGLKFDSPQIGSIYGTMALGAIVSMMVAGQLADRVLASEYLMAIFHLAGAVLLFLLTQVHSYGAFWGVAFAYALVYNPTLAVSNNLAFANIKDSTHFAWIRVFGTIGWIVAGVAVDYVLPKDSDITSRPLLLAAGLSVVLGLFSLILPHTPPTGKKGDALPFVKAFGLLKDPSFAIFFGLSFAITIALAFYYSWAGVFLGDVNVKNIASTMSLGQMSEIGFMLLLPLAIRYIGMKWVLAIGMSAWVARYGLWSVSSGGKPFAFIVLGVLLHGVCFDFFLAAGFIHTDNKAPAAIRGSAQALFSFLTYGVGMWLGNEISGRIVGHYTSPLGAKMWDKIWIVPCLAAAVCLLLFILLWRDRAGKVQDETAIDAAGALPVEGGIAAIAGNCPACGTAFRPESQFCPQCGKGVATV